MATEKTVAVVINTGDVVNYVMENGDIVPAFVKVARHISFDNPFESYGLHVYTSGIMGVDAPLILPLVFRGDDGVRGTCYAKS